jgi:sialidase-1
MINFTAREGKKVLLFTNLEHINNRENLTLKISEDDGKTWRTSQILYPTSAAYSVMVI